MFKRTFRQKDVAGLCLCDDVYPVIYVGNGQDKAREIFTLFNGLAHLLSGFNYLERADKRHYLPSMTAYCMAIENACNQFADEFRDAYERATAHQTLYQHVLDDRAGSAYETGDREFYYTVQGANLGRKYLRAVFGAFEDRRIEESDLTSFPRGEGTPPRRAGKLCLAMTQARWTWYMPWIPIP